MIVPTPPVDYSAKFRRAMHEKIDKEFDECIDIIIENQITKGQGERGGHHWEGYTIENDDLYYELAHLHNRYVIMHQLIDEA